jgi:hypothetical protein
MIARDVVEHLSWDDRAARVIDALSVLSGLDLRSTKGLRSERVLEAIGAEPSLTPYEVSELRRCRVILSRASSVGLQAQKKVSRAFWSAVLVIMDLERPRARLTGQLVASVADAEQLIEDAIRLADLQAKVERCFEELLDMARESGTSRKLEIALERIVDGGPSPYVDGGWSHLPPPSVDDARDALFSGTVYTASGFSYFLRVLNGGTV